MRRLHFAPALRACSAGDPPSLTAVLSSPSLVHAPGRHVDPAPPRLAAHHTLRAADALAPTLEVARCICVAVLCEIFVFNRLPGATRADARALALVGGLGLFHALSLIAVLVQPRLTRPSTWYDELVEPNYDAIDHGVEEKDDEDVDSDEA